MRILSVIALIGALAPLACSDATPLEPVTPAAFAVVPGTGDPDVDAALQTFNNQIVGCALTGNLDRERASHIALLTSVLRFTPSGSDNKTEALLGAIANQIAIADRKGEITPACLSQLNSTLGSIQSLL